MASTGGSLRPAGGGRATPSCQVQIDKEGFVAQRYPFGPFCLEYADDRCFHVALTVTLTPSGMGAVAP